MGGQASGMEIGFAAGRANRIDPLRFPTCVLAVGATAWGSDDTGEPPIPCPFRPSRPKLMRCERMRWPAP